MMTTFSEIQVPPPARWQVEWELCDIASQVSGIARERITPSSRMIQELHLDSLSLIEFIMTVEERFSVTIPDRGDEGSVAKEVFTRDPLLLSDFAEVVIAQWGTGKARRSNRFAKQLAPVSGESMPFLQLDGVMKENAWLRGPLFEPLARLSCGLPQYRRRTDGMRCILIPAADAVLGSDAPEAGVDERPMRRVSMSAFLIDAEPVSATAYARFLNSIGSLPEEVLHDWFLPSDTDRRKEHLPLKRGLRRWHPVNGAERKPVMLVSWFGANAYSLWANRRDWRAYRGDGTVASSLSAIKVVAPVAPLETLFSFLPSEAQWEYAARGAEARRFPWGDDSASVNRACVARHVNGEKYTAGDIPAADVNEPLGLSPFGLHHMAGNVWQWCRDWYAPDFYSSSRATLPDPQNDCATGVRSERGGSWVGPAELARSSYRRGRVPEARGRCLGFRCVGLCADQASEGKLSTIHE